MSQLAESVEKAVAAPLLPAGRAVLVACSGGADSVSLAHAASRRRDLRVVVGHVDHGLRPESRDEAERVRELARQLGTPFYLERIEGLATRDGGLEAAAREARYAALARLATDAGAQAVATAHTRRDQAETLLLRLIRGAGPGAMAGIRATRALAPGIALIRPLLAVGRDATEAYCLAHGLGFTLDPHNSDPRRARARIRALWPHLLELNPRLEEAIAGAANLFADEDDLLEALADESDAAHPALQRRALRARAIEAGLRPERKHIEDLRRLLSRGRGAVDVPGGRATVVFSRATAAGGGAPAEVAVPGPGSYPWRARELSVALGAGGGVPVDLGRAPFPWTLRSHRPGDRFRPSGGCSKKIADLWIDAHVEREQRPGLAVLADAHGQVFWVERLREGEASRSADTSSASFWIR